jgi:hypothetical protein
VSEVERRGKADPKTPTWKPNTRDYQEVEVAVRADHIRSQPLNYGSLEGLTQDQVMMIERNAARDLRRMFDQQGLTLDERTLRPHWQLVVEGYGFKMPEGYIHPEAPQEAAQEAREGWLRAVNGAADSVLKKIYLTVWRRKALPPGQHVIPQKALRAGDSGRINTAPLPPGSVRCVPCDEVFPDRADFDRHVDEVHAPPSPYGEDFEIKAIDGITTDLNPPPMLIKPPPPHDYDHERQRLTRAILQFQDALSPDEGIQILRNLGMPESALGHPEAVNWIWDNGRAEEFIAAVSRGVRERQEPPPSGLG